MRRIFIVVERRADYSRFRPILQEMKKDPFFEIYLVVTGICLLETHGKDINYITEDGFEINAQIPMFVEGSEDTGAEMVRSLSRVMKGLVAELEIAKPDLVLSGFDIGANLAVTIAAAHMNIPVAHIQGGEVTGSIDESIRHAMSKFAHIHFPATELSKERLIKMGERPDSIFVVGCPSIDVLMDTPVIPRKEIEDKLSIDLCKPTLLMIQHPVTTESLSSFEQISETIDAISESKVNCIVALPNNDAGHSKIIEKIKSSGLRWYPSLPTDIFVNLYRNVSALIGNSSSGIHETPTLRIPTINIGTRQQGRERAPNVIDVGYNKTEIVGAIKKAVFDEQFRNFVKTLDNPYGDGHSARRIVEILRTIKLDGIVQKMFYD
ncbi:MAG: UDP-N-acetylglucosamine 2-epimerase [Ignavibacteriales bacterium]|nr:UDP-N-acetylglucosamine 2-epimerase [Melioribacteraceae bacterium]MCF8315147.1 UDP-N-acetylglucosamine 2-epimerase [Ignavibacteriales bacterium]MCF8435857.1 UDP-N-acetylglucosamine 2-epimerase [Ignavibacteriales bacterium]